MTPSFDYPLLYSTRRLFAGSWRHSVIPSTTSRLCRAEHRCDKMDTPCRDNPWTVESRFHEKGKKNQIEWKGVFWFFKCNVIKVLHILRYFPFAVSWRIWFWFPHRTGWRELTTFDFQRTTNKNCAVGKKIAYMPEWQMEGKMWTNGVCPHMTWHLTYHGRTPHWVTALFRPPVRSRCKCCKNSSLGVV